MGSAILGSLIWTISKSKPFLRHGAQASKQYSSVNLVFPDDELGPIRQISPFLPKSLLVMALLHQEKRKGTHYLNMRFLCMPSVLSVSTRW